MRVRVEAGVDRLLKASDAGSGSGCDKVLGKSCRETGFGVKWTGWGIINIPINYQFISNRKGTTIIF